VDASPPAPRRVGSIMPGLPFDPGEPERSDDPEGAHPGDRIA
jgi:hypothetical protein